MIFGLMSCQPREGLKYYINTPMGMGVFIKSYAIYVDKDFGEADRLEIAKAVEQWNHALNGQIRLDIVSFDFRMEPSILKEKADAWFILKIHSDSNFKPKEEPEAPTLAFADKIGGHLIYMIRDRIRNEDMKGIVMHEIGHLFGSDHVGTRLMYKHYQRSQYNCVDYDSIQSVASAQHLEPAGLNYCAYEPGL